MKKVLFILIAAVGFSCSSYAQMSEKELKKATKAAQKTVKDARSFYERDDASARDKADGKRMIDEAIKNPLVMDWDQTWATAALIYREQFFAETVNFNSGSRCDTVAMYDYLVKWFQYSIKADDLQQHPTDPKVKPSNEVRNKQANYINNNLSMLINGGIFFFNNRGDYKKAYEMFNMFYEMADADIIASYVAERPDFEEDKIRFAYFPALCAWRLENWNDVLKYKDLAIQDKGLLPDHNGEASYEIACDAYGNLGDTVNWLKTLKEGMIEYPSQDFYYNKLLNYYNDRGNLDELKDFALEIVKQDPEKAYNYYVLGYVNQKSGDYEKAQEYYKTAIEKDPELVDAYNNLGLCYLEQAKEFWAANENVNIRSNEYKKLLEEEKVFYSNALPVFEKLRELEPDQKDKWALPLYNIYYKLNMSKELNAIESLIDD